MIARIGITKRFFFTIDHGVLPHRNQSRLRRQDICLKGYTFVLHLFTFFLGITVSSSLANLGHSPRMPRLIAPKTCRGACGSKRGPSPSAYSLGDVAARRRSAGYRQSRSRAAKPHAARAWCPCPGTRHDVPLARCDRGDAGLASPRRRSRLTSARVARRAGTEIDATGDRPIHAEHDDPVLYKPLKTAEFLNVSLTTQSEHREPRWKPVCDVQDCLSFNEL